MHLSLASLGGEENGLETKQNSGAEVHGLFLFRSRSQRFKSAKKAWTLGSLDPNEIP